MAVSGDFSFHAGPGDYTEIRDTVLSVPGETEVSMTRGGESLDWEIGSPFVPFRRDSQVLVIDLDHPPALIRNANVVALSTSPEVPLESPKSWRPHRPRRLGRLLCSILLEDVEGKNEEKGYPKGQREPR